MNRAIQKFRDYTPDLVRPEELRERLARSKPLSKNTTPGHQDRAHAKARAKRKLDAIDAPLLDWKEKSNA